MESQPQNPEFRKNPEKLSSMSAWENPSENKELNPPLLL